MGRRRGGWYGLLSTEGVERIFVEQCHDVDQVLGVKMRLGTGFGLMNDIVPLSPNPRSCFWGGWGEIGSDPPGVVGSLATWSGTSRVSG